MAFNDLFRAYAERFGEPPPVFGLSEEMACEMIREALASGEPPPPPPFIV